MVCLLAAATTQCARFTSLSICTGDLPLDRLVPVLAYQAIMD